MMRFKWLVLVVPVSGVLMASFQNFSNSTGLKSQMFIRVDGENTQVLSSSQLKDTFTGRIHEIKLEGGGKAPFIFDYRRFNSKMFWFETGGSINHAKDRSEIRIVGANINFDEMYYTSFKMLYPSWAADTPKDKWSLIWQCPQIGSGPPQMSYNVSPPLNLQLRDNKLFVRTIQDFQIPKTFSGNFRHLDRFVGDVPRDRWVKVLMRYRLGEHGSYKIWLDGKPVLEVRTPIGYKNAFNPFITSERRRQCSVRFGIYKAHFPNRFGLLFNDVRVGTSYDLVRPE